MKGKLIVFEGTDGSGKATQSALLCNYLTQQGIPFRKIDFPRYGKPSAVMVEEYLAGNLGKNPGDVNAYAASMFYAMDRYASFKQDWGDFYSNGGIVIADRYTTSNAVHQASKLPDEERELFLNWLFDLEYRLLELPEPDLVVYLDVPTEVSQRLLQNRAAKGSTEKDIHESDAAYLQRCRDNARTVATICGWNLVDCTQDGSMIPAEAIHKRVLERVLAADILPKTGERREL